MNAPFPGTKLCTGPAHDGPVLLPVTDEFWYFHKTGYAAGKPTNRCKLCTNWDRIKGPQGISGTIDCAKIKVYVQELALRCGSVDAAARYSGVSDGALRSALNGRTCRMQKRVAMKILGSLSQRRHEDSKSGTLSPAFVKELKRRAEKEGQINRDLEV